MSYGRVALGGPASCGALLCDTPPRRWWAGLVSSLEHRPGQLLDWEVVAFVAAGVAGLRAAPAILLHVLIGL